MKPSFVFDIICAGTMLVMAIVYTKKGFLACVVQSLGMLVSIITAYNFAQWASPLIFSRFMEGSLRNKIAQSIVEGGGMVDLAAIAQKYAGFLPESIRLSIVNAFERSVQAALSDNAVVLADEIVSNVLMPLLTPVISVVLFFTAFAACKVVISFLVTVLDLVNHLPVIGQVNRVLGYAMGMVTSSLNIFFALCILWGLMVITGGTLPFLNETALADSQFYTAFSQINPFL